ncbi:ubiquinone biosynthesis monooxygenase COQ6, mitochondrial-like [Diabrotica undecimpunctata]|uniref:ubiquinone biosynthesis monooxygenase COQ6, mitochondrial-like n=1 Tax=Diabrotica undecimpunctata TaxID=50387 RepID=UPI003B642841
MGVHYLNWNYNSTGVVATLKFCEEFDNSIAWQRWLPTGPLALLPLNSSQSSIVWSTTAEDAKRLLKLTNEQFVDAVNEAFWKVFKRSSTIDQAVRSFDTLLRAANCPADVHRTYPPKVSSIEEGSRAAFPLGFGHATNYIGKGVVLVGDAAHRVHPLAGQGVNLGFGDVACLNKVLGETVYSGSSLDEFQATSGVPQGSNLGPLFFLIFVNSIPKSLKFSSSLIYADDLKLFRTVHTSNDCQLLQKDLISVIEWFRDNNMVLNIKKCRVILTPRKDQLFQERPFAL